MQHCVSLSMKFWWIGGRHFSICDYKRKKKLTWEDNGGRSAHNTEEGAIDGVVVACIWRHFALFFVCVLGCVYKMKIEIWIRFLFAYCTLISFMLYRRVLLCKLEQSIFITYTIYMTVYICICVYVCTKFSCAACSNHNAATTTYGLWVRGPESETLTLAAIIEFYLDDSLSATLRELLLCMY